MRPWLAPFVLAAGCTAGAPLGASHAGIINGHVETGRPNVAQLITQISPTTAAECTATLVGTRTLLTAAHCVTGAIAPSTVYFPDLKLVVHSRSVDIVPGYDNTVQSDTMSALDVAVIGLDHDVPLEPARVATAAPWVGEPLHLVGYGITSNAGTDFGTLRAGDNTVAAVYGGYYRVDNTDATHATVCHGDSGGPDFSTAGGVEYVVGVHSRATCDDQWLWGLFDETVAFTTRADAQLSFITQIAAGNLYAGDGHYEKAPPTVTLDVPAEAAEGAGINVTITAGDDVRVASVDLLLDGVSILSRDMDQPTAVVTATLGAGPGVHAVQVIVRDGAGNETRADAGFYVDSTSAGDPKDPSNPGDPASAGDPSATTPSSSGGAQAHGCAMGGTAPTGGPALLLLAMLALLTARRRATAAARR